MDFFVSRRFAALPVSWTGRLSCSSDARQCRYAKHRFIEDGMSPSLWWLKIQHDCMQQGFMNATFLALPTALTMFNDTPSVGLCEVVAWVGMLASFVGETKADLQKDAFFQRQLTSLKSGKQPDDAPVLGLAPWNTNDFSMWTWSRHPNYFL